MLIAQPSNTAITTVRRTLLFDAPAFVELCSMHSSSWSCPLHLTSPFATAVAIALTAIVTAIKLVTLPDGTVASDRAEFTSPSPLWLLPLMDTAKRAASCLTTCEMGHMPPGLNLSKGGDQRLRTENQP